jgi:hypothetical protein
VYFSNNISRRDDDCDDDDDDDDDDNLYEMYLKLHVTEVQTQVGINL